MSPICLNLEPKGKGFYSHPQDCACVLFCLLSLCIRNYVRSKLHEFSIHAIIRHSERILDLAMLSNKDLWLRQYN